MFRYKTSSILQSTSMSFNNTAFLFCDFQKDLWELFPESEAKQLLLNNVSELYRRVVSLREKKNILLVNVGIKLREGYPELGPKCPNNALNWLVGIKKGMLLYGNPGTEFLPEVAPVAGSIVITKLRADAFYPNDLEAILRANQVNHLVICGIATGGVVLSTCSTAADRDYVVTVVGDSCGDLNSELHDVLLKTEFSGRANVITTAEALRLLAE
ncbi:hypothetical protein K7432_010634 [Basidiobolus ranarum]|uniref:Isochorismatase-like domain-containing protein n=1 Tax=Basidiobolus ranarum TaxID=34480 RepID=A0ABR2VV69_9FUNG